jgi:hypothetical protein
MAMLPRTCAALPDVVAVQANAPPAGIESLDTWQRKSGSILQPLLATTFPASSTMFIATTTGFGPTLPTVHCAVCWKNATRLCRYRRRR